MKAQFKLGILAFTTIFSISAWSFGTSIDLGELDIPPGLHRLHANNTNMHLGVDYTLNCAVSPLQEKSALSISEYNLSKIEIYMDEQPYYANSIIPIPAETITHIKLINVRANDYDEAIYFQNLDQTQSMSIHCIADVF